MIKLQEVVGLPSLQYHIDNELSLHDNVYRYSSEAFINLFKEARDAHRDGLIQLNEEDTHLIETTDIGEYGEYNGMSVPLDLPMVSPKYNPLFEIGCMIDDMIEDENTIDEASSIDEMIDYDLVKELVESIDEMDRVGKKSIMLVDLKLKPTRPKHFCFEKDTLRALGFSFSKCFYNENSDNYNATRKVMSK